MAEKTKSTRYVILQQSGSNGIEFSKVGEAEAASATGAIQQVVSEEGNYVAIPARSFQIVPVTVKVVAPKLIVGEPAPAPTVAQAVQAAREQLDEPVPERPVAASAPTLAPTRQ